MTTIPSYLPIDPTWTEREFPSGGSRDDLGIETLSESILADLLPGINNQTNRARYYSFWAWVLRDFINDADTQHTQSSLYTWLRRREAVLILSSLYHGCGGVAGSVVGGQHWENGEKDAYELNWQSLLSVNGGAYQLYYRGALQETNVIVSDDDSPHDDLTKTIGLRLADAYGQAVSQTKYVNKYIDASEIRKSDIKDFADQGCLCQLKKSSEEISALIDTLFRYDTPDIYAVKRLASLALFLDIIDQSDGYPLDNDAFRGAIYFWGYGDNHSYNPQGNLIEPAQRWRFFQLRQYFVFAVESFWSLFLHKIQTDSLTEDGYISWLINEIDFPKAAELLELNLNPKNYDQCSFKSIINEFVGSLPEDTFTPGPKGQATFLNERKLSNLIRAERSRSDATIHAGLGILMLALINKRSESWRSLPGYHYVSNPYASNRLPFDTFSEKMEQAIEEDWSLYTWLIKFHQMNLWLQHRRVTLVKLTGRNQDVAKFHLEYYDGDNQAYFIGEDVDYPKTNAPRFPSALSIFSDLALTEPKGEGLGLTSTGKKLLEEFGTYKVPEWEEPEEEHEITLDLEESRSE